MHTALPYQEVLTWSTDGFYRETRVKVEAQRREGCALVEMECAALATRAGFMGAVWGMILYTSDSLANRVTAVQRTASIYESAQTNVWALQTVDKIKSTVFLYKENRISMSNI